MPQLALQKLEVSIISTAPAAPSFQVIGPEAITTSNNRKSQNSVILSSKRRSIPMPRPMPRENNDNDGGRAADGVDTQPIEKTEKIVQQPSTAEAAIDPRQQAQERARIHQYFAQVAGPLFQECREEFRDYLDQLEKNMVDTLTNVACTKCNHGRTNLADAIRDQSFHSLATLTDDQNHMEVQMGSGKHAKKHHSTANGSELAYKKRRVEQDQHQLQNIHRHAHSSPSTSHFHPAFPKRKGSANGGRGRPMKDKLGLLVRKQKSLASLLSSVKVGISGAVREPKKVRFEGVPDESESITATGNSTTMASEVSENHASTSAKARALLLTPPDGSNTASRNGYDQHTTATATPLVPESSKFKVSRLTPASVSAAGRGRGRGMRRTRLSRATTLEDLTTGSGVKPIDDRSPGPATLHSAPPPKPKRAKRDTTQDSIAATAAASNYTKKHATRQNPVLKDNANVQNVVQGVRDLELEENVEENRTMGKTNRDVESNAEAGGKEKEAAGTEMATAGKDAVDPQSVFGPGPRPPTPKPVVRSRSTRTKSVSRRELE